MAMIVEILFMLFTSIMMVNNKLLVGLQQRLDMLIVLLDASEKKY